MSAPGPHEPGRGEAPHHHEVPVDVPSAEHPVIDPLGQANLLGAEETFDEDAAETTDGRAEPPIDRRTKARDNRSRPPLLLIYSITVTGILANTLVNAPLPDILRDFGQPDDRAGLVVAAATLPGIVMAPIMGLLADRFGRRQVLVPCLVVFGAFGLLGGIAPTFLTLLVCRLMQGIGSAGLINLAVTLIADNWQGRERIRLIGANAAVLTISVAVLPGVGGWLDQIGGWRWSFAPYGLAAFTAIGVIRFVPDHKVNVASRFAHQVRDALHVMKKPVIAWSVILGFVVFALIFGMFLTAMPILLVDEFGLDPGFRGFALSLPAIGSSIAALSMSRTRHRLGTRNLLFVATGLLLVGFFGIGVAGSLVVVGVASVIYGLGEGSTIPTIQDTVASSSPDESRAAVIALWVGSARAGQTAGPLLSGVAIGTIGPGKAFLVAAAVCGALCVVQIFLPAGWYARLDARE